MSIADPIIPSWPGVGGGYKNGVRYVSTLHTKP